MGNIFGKTTTDPSGWISEPDKRGTFGILSTCVVTTLLCVWTALHLNIPPAKETRWRWFGSMRFWRKAVWLFLGLLAPDLVVYTAWYQSREACKVLACKKSVELFDSGDGLPKADDMDRGQWTMAHAFYAVMGGFVLKPPNASKFLPGNKHVMALTASGVRYMIKHQPELLPTLSAEDIRDKSKASSFAKTLVCIQAAWFILQCVTRMATSLPISLLEINTLGHAVGALIMYYFWWHKPLDVEQPTVISSSGSAKVLAFLYMNTKRLPVPYRNTYNEAPEAADIACVTSSSATNQALGDAIGAPEFERGSALAAWRRRMVNLFTRSPLYKPVNEFALVDLLHVEGSMARSGVEEQEIADISIDDLSAWERPKCLRAGVELRPTGLRYRQGSVMLHNSDVRRWALASKLLKDSQVPEVFETGSSADSQNHVAFRVSDLPPLDLDPKQLDWHLLLAFNISSMLYGGLHALAWNASFRSDSRKGLWRLSSLGVMGFFAVSTLILFVEKLAFQGRQTATQNKALKASHFVLYRLEIAGITFMAGFLTFLAARMYLLVECYLTLTDLPEGAYDLPQWSRYIPHV